MVDSSGLLDLQKRQQEHDKDYHRDIFTLPYPGRMNHYVHHFSKYVGRLSRDYPDEETRTKQLEKTVADSFIVGLAAANTLNLDLQEVLSREFGLNGDDVATMAMELDKEEGKMDFEELQHWLFKEVSTPTGRMADAMESLDHMEPMDTREILEDGTIELVSTLLVASEHLGADIEKLVTDRWSEIEEKSIL